MPIYQVLVLALVQGLTEFLPISSSGHLALAPWLLGWKDPGLTFDIALHFGTLAAVVFYFFRDWVAVITNAFGRRNSDPDLGRNPHLLWWILAATIPVGLAGLAAHDYAEHSWRNPFVIGAMLILVGILMGIADRRLPHNRGIGQMNWSDAAAVGIAQALAVVPGTSRSGITMTAALFRHMERHDAARFSFLLSTPAIGAAALKSAYDLHKAGGVPPDMQIPFVVGMIVSGLTGCLVIRFFLQYLRRRDFKFFVYYRIIFGIIVIALASFIRPTG